MRVAGTADALRDFLVEVRDSVPSELCALGKEFASKRDAVFDPENVEDAFRGHKLKAELIVAIVDYMDKMREKAAGSLSSLQDGNPLKGLLEESLTPFQQLLVRAMPMAVSAEIDSRMSQAAKRLLKETDGKLWKIKERGFYVDESDNGRYVAPDWSPALTRDLTVLTSRLVGLLEFTLKFFPTIMKKSSQVKRESGSA